MLPKDDITKIERNLREAELRLTANKAKIDLLARERDSMVILEGQLKENLANLKKKGIIALVIEYRKSKADLVKTRVRLSQVEWDLASAEFLFKETVKSIDQLHSIFDKLLAKMGKNVLEGKWPKK